jgi:hypothetical protein
MPGQGTGMKLHAGALPDFAEDNDRDAWSVRAGRSRRHHGAQIPRSDIAASSVDMRANCERALAMAAKSHRSFGNLDTSK